MLSELQIQNIGTVFDILDHDSNGIIERGDFEAIVREILADTGLPPASPKRKATEDSYIGWWLQFVALADKNANGQVEREEYFAFIEQGLSTDSAYLTALDGVADAVFAAADSDDDGGLEQAELVGVYRGIGVSADVAEGAFQQIDTDGDGKISADEFRAALRGVFTSIAPQQVGSNMFGNA